MAANEVLDSIFSVKFEAYFIPKKNIVPTTPSKMTPKDGDQYFSIGDR
jgi:hypothetical protein